MNKYIITWQFKDSSSDGRWHPTSSSKSRAIKDVRDWAALVYFSHPIKIINIKKEIINERHCSY